MKSNFFPPRKAPAKKQQIDKPIAPPYQKLQEFYEEGIKKCQEANGQSDEGHKLLNAIENEPRAREFLDQAKKLRESGIEKLQTAARYGHEQALNYLNEQKIPLYRETSKSDPTSEEVSSCRII